MIYNEDCRAAALEFFNNLAELGKFFNDALESYCNEDYDDVKSVDNSVEDTEAQTKCGETVDCCCDCKCDDTEEIHETYKLHVTDFSVDSFDNACKAIAPKLNALVFAMRCETFSDVEVIFEFNETTYDFVWNSKNDRFEGKEYSAISTKEVYWYEVKNEVRYTDKTYNDNETAEETVDSAETPDNVNNCIYKNSAFYPYGEKCKDCPHKEECFTDEKDVKLTEDSQDAVYTADGDAITEEEIPSLKDYTAEERKTVEKEEEKIHTKEHVSPETVVTEPKIFTGASLYKDLNNKFKKDEEKYIKILLTGVQNLLASGIYTICKCDDNTDINKIKFSLGEVRACVKAPYSSEISEYVDNIIHPANFAKAIEKAFEFKHVDIYNGDVYCQLI